MELPTPRPIDEAQSLLAELMAIPGPVSDESLKPYARRISEIGERAKRTDLPVFETLRKCLERIGEIGGGVEA
jgi:hypothetical protein